MENPRAVVQECVHRCDKWPLTPLRQSCAHYFETVMTVNVVLTGVGLSGPPGGEGWGGVIGFAPLPKFQEARNTSESKLEVHPVKQK